MPKALKLYRPNLITMRTILPLIVCIFLVASSHAQQASKLDLRLYTMLQKGELKGQQVPLLVKGNLAELKKLATEMGGKYKYGYSDIASVAIPAENVQSFAASNVVLQISGTGGKGHMLMDTARIRSNVDSVHAGFMPLPNALKGKDVVMGIIDGGIYYQHADFRNADSTNRIKFIWDQKEAHSNTPLPYNYGTECNMIDIDNGSCLQMPYATDFGHGTCVAGIAAGNGYSVRGTQYEDMVRGVAPESDIIAVRIEDNDNFFETHVADAIDYIFKKADAMGKPCVINTSIGTYYGSHDGNDVATKLIEAMLEERSGRVLVAAAGNAGNTKHHLSYDITATPAFTFFNSGSTTAYIDFWADTSNFSNAQFSIGCNSDVAVDLGAIPYHSVSDYNGLVIEETIDNGGNTLGKVSSYVGIEEGKYHVEFLIENISNINNLWRLETKGSGRFDLWGSMALIGSANIVTTLGGFPIGYPEYRQPDSLKTIVSSWQCSDKVITVGNYSNRAGYLDRDSVYQDLTAAPYNETVGKRFETSSFGPTRDGRLKPDVMATGSTIICTGDPNFIALAVSAQNRVKVSITQKHIRNGGTSMASPVVAGIAALYLQQHPNASYQEVKDVLIATAVKDNFTGPTANNEYGNGKVNAFRALAYTGIVYGAMDTACINYNPNANIDTGGCQLRVFGVMDTACINYNPNANTAGGVCEAKVYGCTDPAALNYDTSANVENSTCNYPNVGINEADARNLNLTVMPNPFKGQTTFNVINNGYNFTNGSIKIYNPIGSLADEIAIGNTTSAYTYSNNKLSSGVYFYSLILDGKRAKTGKLIVE